MLIDDLHLFTGRTDRAKDIARSIVNDLGPQASMSVLYTSGEHSIEITEDRSELLAAIDQLKGRRLVPRPIPGRDSGDKEFYDNMTAYKTLEDAARMLTSGAARRKAFVLVSEGIGKDLTGVFDGPITPCEMKNPMAPCHHDVSLRQMMDAMQRSNVATYAIDPRGFVSTEDLAAECRPSPAGNCDPCMGDCPGQVPDWDGWVRGAQHGLEITAKASGGFAITNTNDFTTGLGRIIDDLDHYYLLGFYPSDPQGKGYRPIEVRVNRPGVTLHYRTGYDPGGPPPPKNADPLMGLASGAIPETGLALRLMASPLVGRTIVALEVTEPTAGLTAADGSVGDSLRYTVFAVDLKNGKIARQFTNTAQVTFDRNSADAKTRDSGNAVAFQLPVELPLGPGHYQLRASVSSHTLGKGGSVYLAIDVPDFGAAPLVLSGLMVGYAEGAHVAVGTKAPGAVTTEKGAPASASKPAPAGAVSVADLPTPTLDREFASSDTLRVYFEVARQGPSVIIRMTTAIVDSRDRVINSSSQQMGPTTKSLDQTLSLKGLAPGAYRVRVTATDGSKPTTREVGFAIK
jgi:VWFA-related protein